MEQNLGSGRIAVRLLGSLKPYWGLALVVSARLWGFPGALPVHSMGGRTISGSRFW